MKGHYDILLIVILLFTAILIFISFGSYIEFLWLSLLEGAILIVIIILLVRYFRAKK